MSPLGFCDIMIFGHPLPVLGGVGRGAGSSLSSEPLSVGILRHSELGSCFFSLHPCSFLCSLSMCMVTQTSNSSCPNPECLVAHLCIPTCSSLKFPISAVASATHKSYRFHLQNTPSCSTATLVQATVTSHLGPSSTLVPFQLVKEVKL